MKEEIFQIDRKPGAKDLFLPLDLCIKSFATDSKESLNLLINPVIATMGLSGEDFTGGGARYEYGSEVTDSTVFQGGPDTVEAKLSMNGITKGQFITYGKEYQIELQSVTSDIVDGKEYPSFTVLVRDLTSS
jgi:hypothetical protein